MGKCKTKIGFGYDVHRLAEDRELYLGGIKIAYHQGLMGHSDADVLLHAICDALLGAAGLRDIGYHFPDNDATYKNISSKLLLEKTMILINELGYEVGNIDCTICAEQPKINPHIPLMKKQIAQLTAIEPEDISIKATTSEQMGFVGREEGMAAYAVALIFKN